MKNCILVVCFLCICGYLKAQTIDKDTVKVVNLNEVIIKDPSTKGLILTIPEVKDNVIYAGKKTAVIQISSINADLSTNSSRQVFAKIPGISIWESEGSGIQTGIASRGLSPNRSWEFNVRQNGIDITSEVFGYPETYYTPPMEALSKVEIVKGASSLQYGPQFGGLINYEVKKGNATKPITFETQQTVGSYGLFNTFNALGGHYKKFTYYGFMHFRTAQGWRENSEYNIYSGYVSGNYQLSKSMNIGIEYTKMDYRSQQPGGVTDVQFQNDHRVSTRERNWLSAPFSLLTLKFNFEIKPNIHLSVKSFTNIAERNSVGYTKSISLPDSINPSLQGFNARQVDRDSYKNFGTEARISVNYKLLNKTSILAGGVRFYSGATTRKQLGVGTTGSSYDLTLTNPQYGRSLNFETFNYAVFAENIFKIGNRLKIIPGARFEYIQNAVSGYITTTDQGKINDNSKSRSLLLFGLGSEFILYRNTNLYCNFSQAYRPVTFSELIPSATTEIVDPNLRDASGFNFDLGYRGSYKNFLTFDVGMFYLNYDDRIGTITQNAEAFKTNIGTSVSKGIESYIELDIVKIFSENTKYGSISIFAANTFMNATYVGWNNPLIANDPTKAITNKRVENAPNYIHRFGATYYLNYFSASLQFSNVGDVFTDAVNTEQPNAAGTIGKLNAYEVIDFSLALKVLKNYSFKAGINNLMDEKYATRRATGYPGPGLMPANGRTFFITLGATL
jgi:Fe(3+) dicitrate transport protein